MPDRFRDLGSKDLGCGVPQVLCVTHLRGCLLIDERRPQPRPHLWISMTTRRGVLYASMCRRSPPDGKRTLPPASRTCARAEKPTGLFDVAQASLYPESQRDAAFACPNVPCRAVEVHRMHRGTSIEAHIPAERSEAGQAPRLSPPHVDEGGTSGACGPTPQGPASPVRLSRLSGRSSHAVVRRRGRRVRRGPLSVTRSPLRPRRFASRIRRRRLGHSPARRCRGHAQPGAAPPSSAAR